jgi:trehalose 6-phosphate synthase
VLWPILHYRLDLAEFTRRDLGGYFRVNQYFATHLEKLLRPDDVLWVHDYHLIPLAKALRDRGHNNKIGFFIHIPFPPPEILTALPNHDQLIPALCHYDLVGYQTEVDAANFSRYIANEIGLPWANGNSFHFGNRVVQIGTFPVGVETEAFARLARRAIETEFVRDVLGSSSRIFPTGAGRSHIFRLHPAAVQAFPNMPIWAGR